MFTCEIYYWLKDYLASFRWCIHMTSWHTIDFKWRHACINMCWKPPIRAFVLSNRLWHTQTDPCATGDGIGLNNFGHQRKEWSTFNREQTTFWNESLSSDTVLEWPFLTFIGLLVLIIWTNRWLKPKNTWVLTSGEVFQFNGFSIIHAFIFHFTCEHLKFHRCYWEWWKLNTCHKVAFFI